MQAPFSERMGSTGTWALGHMHVGHVGTQCRKGEEGMPA